VLLVAMIVLDWFDRTFSCRPTSDSLDVTDFRFLDIH
jgi:hypothetical protein